MLSLRLGQGGQGIAIGSDPSVSLCFFCRGWTSVNVLSDPATKRDDASWRTSFLPSAHLSLPVATPCCQHCPAHVSGGMCSNEWLFYFRCETRTLSKPHTLASLQQHKRQTPDGTVSKTLNPTLIERKVIGITNKISWFLQRPCHLSNEFCTNRLNR